VDIREDYVILENGGIGYRIYTSSTSLMDLELNKMATMYTYLSVREEGISLYGFSSEEELSMFCNLILVSKIGPKGALNILSTLTPQQIVNAIHNNEADLLCAAPGIGKKTANRIILELKDRIPKDLVLERTKVQKEDDHVQLAIDGVMTLGYTRGEVYSIIKQLDISSMDTEQIIREVLKRLSK
ncbi:MAG: Holliday junction branch migration protein RuvA, partial [Tissierellales bacterium]